MSTEDGQTAESTDQATDQTTLQSLASGIPDDQQVGDTSQQQTETKTQTQSQPQNKGGDNVADFNKFAAEIQSQNQNLVKEIASLKEGQDELQNDLHRESVNKAVDAAVETINESVGGDKLMAELYLQKQYNQNPDLKKIFLSREAHPEAYTKALSLLNVEWGAMNKVKIDPQIAENQRALQASQKGGSTVIETSKDDQMAAMSDAEFMRTGNKIARSN